MRAKLTTVMIISSALLVSACGSRVDVGSAEDRALLHARADSSLQQLVSTDPGLKQQIDSSYGYAIFPNIITGAVGVGGAHGDGEVYRNGKFAGWADMSQGTIGVQLGGQKYAELILFRDSARYLEFTNGTFEFQAGASAVAASAGAAATADYNKGVAVFTLPMSGAMLQAAVGGQKFRFTPANDTGYTAVPNNQGNQVNYREQNPGTPTYVPQPGSPSPQ